VKQPSPLILTAGEPGGIGPEISMRAWQELRGDGGFSFAILADIDHLRTLAETLGLNAKLLPIKQIGDCPRNLADGLPVLHRPLLRKAQCGTTMAENAEWVISLIREAAEECLSGSAGALVTNPIQKESLYAAGFYHQGHTDYLAAIARQSGHDTQEVMMLVGGGLRAVPVTVHIALKEVPTHLTQDAIIRQARVVARELPSKFGVIAPRLAITGLNPHAGENGSMGREELDVIAPAIAVLRLEGIQVVGPLPADSAFTPEMRETYDAILCMYHDQALIPVKALDFHGGVNVTLGLPFIRTSPDHGTALTLAGTGKAKPDSLIAALKLAAAMAQRAAGA
jgi:4-hydroxythreonine-4-phosphate dehydrogenase